MTAGGPSVDDRLAASWCCSSTSQNTIDVHVTACQHFFFFFLHLRVCLQPLFDDRYCNSPRNRLRGAAAVDILALQALGLSVLPLPLQEWQALGDSPSEQQRYLKARVAAATM